MILVNKNSIFCIEFFVRTKKVQKRKDVLTCRTYGALLKGRQFYYKHNAPNGAKSKPHRGLMFIITIYI